MIAKRYSYRFNPRCRASRTRYRTKNAFAMFNRITSSPGNNVAMPAFVQSRPRRASKNAAAAAACLRCHHRHPRSHCCARPACRPCERACSADHRPLRHPRQLCSGAARARSTIVVIVTKYPALARVLALHDRTAKSSMSFPHDVHACAKRRTQPRRRRHDVAPALPARMPRSKEAAHNKRNALCIRHTAFKLK